MILFQGYGVVRCEGLIFMRFLKNQFFKHHRPCSMFNVHALQRERKERNHVFFRNVFFNKKKHEPIMQNYANGMQMAVKLDNLQLFL